MKVETVTTVLGSIEIEGHLGKRVRGLGAG